MRRLEMVLLALVFVGCGSKSTPGAATPETVTAESKPKTDETVTRAEPDVVATPEPDTVAAPEPDAVAATEPDTAAVPEPDTVAAADGVEVKKKPTRPGAGVLPEATLDQLWEADWGVSDRPTRAQIFERAHACQEDPDAEGCAIPEGFIATFEDKVLVRAADDMGGCGDADPAWGYVLGADGKAGKKTKLHIVMDDAKNTPVTTFAWVQKMAAEGFAPVETLITAHTYSEAGIRMTQPVALLGAPLAGWFFEARTLEDDGTELSLVSPDNQTRHVLGSQPKKSNKDCTGEERTDGMCGDFIAPSLVDIALSADKLMLFVLGYQTDGGHCSSSPAFVKAYPLPKAVALGE